MALKNNTWKLNQWYDQDVAGNISYSGAKQLWVWGQNHGGQLGQNQSQTKYSSPVQIPGTTWGSDIGKISLGSDAIGSIRTNGELWVLGANVNGSLGVNNETSYSSPVQVPGTWSYVNMGWDFSAAINTDGELWMWGAQGANPNGVLGQNQGTTKYSSPVQIPGSTWKNIALGQVTVFATKTDGTMWAWGGQNDAGNLGLNQGGSWSQHMRSSPTQIPGTTWDRPSVNSTSSHATRTDGTLWSWGINNNGQLGLSNNTNYSSPVQVGSGTDWSVVTNGSAGSTFGLKTDGTLWSWGYNVYGQLGLNTGGSGTNVNSPSQIPGTNWSNISGGSYAALARKTDGTLWSWGHNIAGTLGVNNRTSYSSPVQVPGTDWVNAIGGTNDSKSFIGIKNV